MPTTQVAAQADERTLRDWAVGVAPEHLDEEALKAVIAASHIKADIRVALLVFQAALSRYRGDVIVLASYAALVSLCRPELKHDALKRLEAALSNLGQPQPLFNRFGFWSRGFIIRAFGACFAFRMRQTIVQESSRDRGATQDLVSTLTYRRFLALAVHHQRSALKRVSKFWLFVRSLQRSVAATGQISGTQSRTVLRLAQKMQSAISSTDDAYEQLLKHATPAVCRQYASFIATTLFDFEQAQHYENLAVQLDEQQQRGRLLRPIPTRIKDPHALRALRQRQHLDRLDDSEDSDEVGYTGGSASSSASVDVSTMRSSPPLTDPASLKTFSSRYSIRVFTFSALAMIVFLSVRYFVLRSALVAWSESLDHLAIASLSQWRTTSVASSLYLYALSGAAHRADVLFASAKLALATSKLLYYGSTYDDYVSTTEDLFALVVSVYAGYEVPQSVADYNIDWTDITSQEPAGFALELLLETISLTDADGNPSTSSSAFSAMAAVAATADIFARCRLYEQGTLESVGSSAVCPETDSEWLASYEYAEVNAVNLFIDLLDDISDFASASTLAYLETVSFRALELAIFAFVFILLTQGLGYVLLLGSVVTLQDRTVKSFLNVSPQLVDTLALLSQEKTLTKQDSVASIVTAASASLSRVSSLRALSINGQGARRLSVTSSPRLSSRESSGPSPQAPRRRSVPSLAHGAAERPRAGLPSPVAKKERPRSLSFSLPASAPPRPVSSSVGVTPRLRPRSLSVSSFNSASSSSSSSSVRLPDDPSGRRSHSLRLSSSPRARARPLRASSASSSRSGFLSPSLPPSEDDLGAASLTRTPSTSSVRSVALSSSFTPSLDPGSISSSPDGFALPRDLSFTRLSESSVPDTDAADDGRGPSVLAYAESSLIGTPSFSPLPSPTESPRSAAPSLSLQAALPASLNDYAIQMPRGTPQATRVGVPRPTEAKQVPAEIQTSFFQQLITALRPAELFTLSLAILFLFAAVLYDYSIVHSFVVEADDATEVLSLAYTRYTTSHEAAGLTSRFVAAAIDAQGDTGLIPTAELYRNSAQSSLDSLETVHDALVGWTAFLDASMLDLLYGVGCNREPSLSDQLCPPAAYADFLLFGMDTCYREYTRALNAVLALAVADVSTDNDDVLLFMTFDWTDVGPTALIMATSLLESAHDLTDTHLLRLKASIATSATAICVSLVLFFPFLTRAARSERHFISILGTVGLLRMHDPSLALGAIRQEQDQDALWADVRRLENIRSVTRL
jgi:hypothetical protein